MSAGARASGADDPRRAGGADEPAGADDADAVPATEDEHHPKGTLLLSVVFLVVLAGAWLLMYITLLERS